MAFTVFILILYEVYIRKIHVHRSLITSCDNLTCIELLDVLKFLYVILPDIFYGYRTVISTVLTNCIHRYTRMRKRCIVDTRFYVALINGCILMFLCMGFTVADLYS